MTALRILLVDDESPARLRLRALLDEVNDPALTVVGEAEDASQAEALLQREAIDLVLLDIGLPGRDGLRLAARWRAMGPAPSIVFVTAHAEHALRAFELDAVDYLTKPVRRDRLLAALQRVARRRLASQSKSDAPMLVVSDRGRVLRLPLNEVLYVKAELKYVTLRTPSHTYVLDDALADLETRLGAGYLRIHRNAVVARAAVRALARRPGLEGDGWAVEVAPTGDWLEVSRRQLGMVRQALSADVGGNSTD